MTRIALVLALAACATPARADDRKVTVRFLGGATKVPIDGLKVTVRRHTGDWAADLKNKVAAGTTDKDGRAGFALADGDYYVDVDSDEETPYLDRPVGFRTPPNIYSRIIKVEKAQAFEFNLAAACRLTLRAVDADTGRGIPGVEFVTESQTAEQWGVPITGDNIGARQATGARGRTDADGYFTRLVGPREGYTYFAWAAPAGYVQLGKPEVTLPTPIGTEKVEHVFRFRKAK